jgi:sugar transferase EpsL
LDLFSSTIGLILLLPLLLFTAFLIRVMLGTPVIFRQERPGLHGKLFKLYKFRTMTDERDYNGELLSDELRLTSFGKLLRNLSIDELPQLFNVIKGDMSLIGPRPLLKEYLPRYSEEQAKRHHVRPGITGWAQVNGRNAITWDEKFQYDVWYVENHSLFLDLKILFLTVKKVLISDGISNGDHATMPDFEGNGSKNQDKFFS